MRALQLMKLNLARVDAQALYDVRDNSIIITSLCGCLQAGEGKWGTA